MGGVGNYGDDLFHIERLGEEENVQAKEQVSDGEREAAPVGGHEDVVVPGRQLLVRRHLAQCRAGLAAPTRLRQHCRCSAPFRLVPRRGALSARPASYIMKRPYSAHSAYLTGGRWTSKIGCTSSNQAQGIVMSFGGVVGGGRSRPRFPRVYLCWGDVTSNLLSLR
jgi:hypothetical protein